MLSAIHLVHFRNYDECRLELCPGFNCIVGSNGQGKTNLLEAIYYLSLLRSFRAGNVNEMKQFKSQGFALHCEAVKPGFPPVRLSVNYGTERHLLVNGVPVYRASDFINRFTCMAFIPQDLSLVQGAPLLRRRFLDISISQTSPEYMHHLQKFQEALHSRNLMLKNQVKYTRDTITAYDAVLAREAAEIEVMRRDFAESLNRYLEMLSGELIGDGRKLEIRYLSRIGPLLQEQHVPKERIEAAYMENLNKAFAKDLETGTTELGPHRSDFSCLLGGIFMQRYASQGECRTGSLALKLACFNLVREKVGDENVTLLVDDVVGELDADRRARFFNSVCNSGQTVFACTGIPPEIVSPDCIYRVRGGALCREK